MNTNDIIELEIEKMSSGPTAVGRLQTPDNPRPMVVFVEGTLPGEKIKAKLTKNHKSYWEAELVEIMRPSPDRVEAPCPVFGKCGGCQWQHLSYSAQIHAKEDILLHHIARTTRLAQDELKAKLKTYPAKNPLGYRARMQVHGDKKGIGFFENNSHEIVHTDKCLIAHPDIQKSWTEFASSRPLAALAKKNKGQFKIEWTRTESGQVKEMIDRKQGADGFSQVNSEQNQVLIDLVTQLAKKNVSQKKTHLLMDLYGGDGNLSKQLVQNFDHVLSVDTFNSGEKPGSIESIEEKGRIFIQESTEKFLQNKHWLNWGFKEVDCVIVDPPRNGLREASELTAALNAPRIILVSCDPSTLARDLTAFTSSYLVESIHLIDMFPQTYHLETVVELIRKT